MPRLSSSGCQKVWEHASSSEDEGVTSAQVLHAADSVFGQYLSKLQLDQLEAEGDSLFSQGLERVRACLASSGVSAGASGCLICLGTIKPQEAVWTCARSCHDVFHLTCIQEWARSQIDAHVLKTMNRLSQFPGAAAEARAHAEWGCPKCRCPYPASKLPTTYLCFCGKQADPEWDPWRAPHSCGDVCGKPLGAGSDKKQQLQESAVDRDTNDKDDNGPDSQDKSQCSHSCLLLCHPGPCPPCPLVIDAQCYCGKRHDKRRCGHHTFSCGQVCGRVLPCGHACQQACHAGPCPPCEVVGMHSCCCGKESRQIACCKSVFQCTRPCNRKLDCGQHACERGCHSGPCGPCPSQGARRCPCGKQEYADMACTDKPPACGATCGKLLPCGIHTCQDRCHYGDCSSCRSTVNKTCRCGKLQKEVGCSVELLCEKRCTNMRACGRHPCKRKCCDGESCPPCEEVCGRKLRCGNHRCPAPCHSGPCRPCPLTISFSCACGKLTSTLPCGAEGRAVAPRCYSLCPVVGLCRHVREEGSTTKPHRCHYGPCPSCKKPCGSKLPCGHVCSATTCHDPRPPAVSAFKTPTAPKVQLTMAAVMGDTNELLAVGNMAANGRNRSSGGGSKPANETISPALQAAKESQDLVQTVGLSPCPPCSVAVQISCLGQHETQEVACSEAKPYSCNRLCGQKLACGNHSCQLPCHVRLGAANNSSAGAQACQQCDQKCGRQRACGHPCEKPCHTGPCDVCCIPVKAACRCGKSSLSLACHTLTTAAAFEQQLDGGRDEGKNIQLSPTNTQDDPLSCGKPCHKPLPYCPHPCRENCHAGPCPGSITCEELVTVKCSCKRLKAKWPCHQVQAALRDQGRSGVYDDTTALKLLECGHECVNSKALNGSNGGAVAKKTSSTVPADSSSNDVTKKLAPATVNLIADSTKSNSSVSPPEGKRRQTRQEREAEAAKREKERLRKQRIARVKSALMWALIVVIGLLLGVFGPQLMSQLDQRAQQAWKPRHVRRM